MDLEKISALYAADGETVSVAMSENVPFIDLDINQLKNMAYSTPTDLEGDWTLIFSVHNPSAKLRAVKNGNDDDLKTPSIKELFDQYDTLILVSPKEIYIPENLETDMLPGNTYISIHNGVGVSNVKPNGVLIHKHFEGMKTVDLAVASNGYVFTACYDRCGHNLV
ncbi:MAG: hypothetical protein GOU98_02685 [Candidatus Altiarchaeota archaeon]|nr:hypothetical protein [Candidatus Altiarchaeota archaeon]